MRKAIKFHVMRHTFTVFEKILHIYIFLSRKEVGKYFVIDR